MLQTNWYTLLFALIMSAAVAGGLASLKELWGPTQKANELLFNKTQILSSVIEVSDDTDVETIFDERVQGALINNKGEVVEENTVAALETDVKKEQKKLTTNPEEVRLPVYTYKSEDGGEQYIFPTFGSGLWGWISSYIALENDKNQVAGITFDHESETPGLGAEIKDDPGFYTDFKGEKIFDGDQLVGVRVRKSNNDPLNNDKSDHTVDAISGATITSDGVEDMLKKDLQFYKPFLETTEEKI